MLRNMANSLIEHKRIVTTTAKAKALRKFIEPLVTKAVRDFKAQGGEAKKNPHARRVVFSYLNNKEAVTELFDNIAQTVGDRPGGYTRILKIGNRAGDNADMSFIEFVDFSEYDTGKSADTGKSSRRRRRRRGKKSGGDTDHASNEAKQTQKVAEEASEEATAVAAEAAEEVEEKTQAVIEDAEEVTETAAPATDAAEETTEESAEEKGAEDEGKKD